jgi:hypothetical protein
MQESLQNKYQSFGMSGAIIGQNSGGSNEEVHMG